MEVPDETLRRKLFFSAMVHGTGADAVHVADGQAGQVPSPIPVHVPGARCQGLPHHAENLKITVA